MIGNQAFVCRRADAGPRAVNPWSVCPTPTSTPVAVGAVVLEHAAIHIDEPGLQAYLRSRTEGHRRGPAPYAWAAGTVVQVGGSPRIPGEAIPFTYRPGERGFRLLWGHDRLFTRADLLVFSEIGRCYAVGVR